MEITNVIMRQDIFIYGAGGFGREVLSLINRLNTVNNVWNILGFIDDGIPPGTFISDIPVLGDINFINNYEQKVAVAIAVGNVKLIKGIYESIKNSNVYYPNIIDPLALIDPTVKLGKGNIITYLNFLSCNVVLNDFNILNTKCAIGHDSHLGSFNILNPNVQISGNVQIGNETFWGLNSSVVQGKRIANNSTIGASSLLLKSIKEEGSFYFGIPAIKRNMNI